LALQAILFRSFKSWFTVACVLAVMFRVRYMFKSGKLKKHPFMNPVNIFVYDDFTAIPFIVYVGLITWGVNWYTLLIWFVILMLVHILFGKDKTRDSWLGRRCDGEVTLWFLFLSSFILTVSSRQTDYTSFTVAVCIISFLLIFDVYTWLISTGYKTYSDYYNKEKPPKRYLAGFRFLYYKLHH